MVIEQSYTTKETNTDNSTKIEIYKEKYEWWDELIPSSSYLFMSSFSSALESLTSFNRKDRQIGEMLELVETFQKSQMDNTIGESAPIILS